jgi:CheY-like chemotaxis protein
VISLHIDPKDILRRVNRHFRYDAQSTNTEDAKPSESMKKKILWVEDDKLIGNILEKKLLNSGFNLYHATEGNDALKYLDGNIPDVIILDLLLPGMSGFDILQKIRTDMRLKKIPVIILSNFNKPSDIEKAKILGAQKYLVKAAISLDQIVEEVKELIK